MEKAAPRKLEEVTKPSSTKSAVTHKHENHKSYTKKHKQSIYWPYLCQGYSKYIQMVKMLIWGSILVSLTVCLFVCLYLCRNI